MFVHYMSSTYIVCGMAACSRAIDRLKRWWWWCLELYGARPTKSKERQPSEKRFSLPLGWFQIPGFDHTASMTVSLNQNVICMKSWRVCITECCGCHGCEDALHAEKWTGNLKSIRLNRCKAVDTVVTGRCLHVECCDEHHGCWVGRSQYWEMSVNSVGWN